MTRCLLLNLPHKSTINATKPASMLGTRALALALVVVQVFPPLVQDPWIGKVTRADTDYPNFLNESPLNV